MRKALLSLPLALLLAAAHGAAWAVACTSVANNNWNVLATWGAGGCPGANGVPANTPGPGDTVTIATTVGITSAVTVAAITNITGTLRFSGAPQTMTVLGNVSVGGGTFTVQNVAGANTHTLNIAGNLTNAGTFNMVVGDDAANVTLNGAGVQLVSGAGATMQFAGLTIASGGLATFSRSFSVARNMTDNGNFRHTVAASRVTFNGTVAQSLLGAAANTTFQNVTMTNTAAVATRSLTIGHDMTVATNLTYTAGGGSGGRIITGASKVVIQAAGAAAITNACPTDTNDFVAGNLQRLVAAGGSTVAFPVGINAAAGCRQASIVFVGVAAGGGSLIASTTTGDHPQIGISGLDSANSLNRYWTLTTTGVTGTALPAFTSYSATFTFVAADLDAGTNPLAFIATRFAAGVWNATGEGPVTATTFGVAAVTALGEFAAGEVLGYNAVLGRFNAYDPAPVTPANSVHGNIRTKISGTGFSLTVVHLDAAGAALASFGAVTAVNVTLMDARDNSGGFTAGTNCRTTWAAIPATTIAINFAAAATAQTVNYTAANIHTNSWKEVRVRAVGGGQTGCSGDSFAIRPQTFATAVSDATWTTAGTGRTLNVTTFNGAPAHKAGRPFTIRATQMAAGVANNYFAAGNHTGTPTLRTLDATEPTGGVTACTALHADGILTFGPFVAAGGVLTANNANYTEAGTFNLALHDTAYAQIDAADTPATYSNVAPFGRFVSQSVANLAVGRFVPDDFLVTVTTVPVFRTFNMLDAACSAAAPAPKRSFTYLGQPFGYATAPVFTVTARDAAGNTTTNYRECLWKIAGANVAQTYSTTNPGKTLDPALAGTPSVTPGNGSGTISTAPAGVIAFQRVLNPAPPDSAFQAAIDLQMNASDNAEPDGTITGTAATTTGIGFDGGDFNTGAGLTAGRTMVYGRARLLNFTTNAMDHCTPFTTNNFTLLNHQGGITPNPPPAGNMPVSNISAAGPVNAGVGTITLARPTPTPTAPGSVDICFDLGADAPVLCTASASAGQFWLQNINTGTNYDDDPVARAAFGVYGSQPSNFIYFRENY
jgi:MSHA biogenesis protein MshQ